MYWEVAMLRTHFAEYLLRGFVSRDRAEEIVGDLLESYGPSSRTGFWFALFGVMVRFAWRPVTALLIAAAVCVTCEFALTAATARHFAFGPSRNLLLTFRSWWFAGKSASLAALAVFALLRYGFRDPTSWVAALYAGLCTLYVYTLWMPSLRIGFYVCSALTLLLCLSGRMLRRSSLLVAVSLVGWITSNWILSGVFHVLFSLRISRGYVRGHLHAVELVECLPFVVTMILFTLLHRRMMWVDPTEAQAF